MEIIETIRERKIFAIVIGLVFLGALISIWRTLRPPTPKLPHTLFQTVGQVAAEETANALGHKGRLVPVIEIRFQMGGTLAGDQWLIFQKELKKYSSISLVPPEIVAIDPDEGSTALSGPQFKAVIDKHPDADGFVFFTTLPEWKGLEKHHLIPSWQPAHIIVVDIDPNPNSDYLSYFTYGYVTTLIRARITPAPPPKPGANRARIEFDQNFEILTVQNYDPSPSQ